MHTPPSAIEAAARAWHDEIERSVIHPGEELVLWDYEDEDVKEHYITTARANVKAAIPHILRAAAIAAREENEHIVEGDGAYSSGFHYALAWVEGDPENPAP